MAWAHSRFPVKGTLAPSHVPARPDSFHGLESGLLGRIEMDD
jgi:hypothetical protein